MQAQPYGAAHLCALVHVTLGAWIPSFWLCRHAAFKSQHRLSMALQQHVVHGRVGCAGVGGACHCGKATAGPSKLSGEQWYVPSHPNSVI